MRIARRALGGIIVLVVVLLVLIRWVGSPIATHLANRKLAELPQFTGHVDAVQLALWRGTIGIRGFELSSREDPAAEKVVRVDHGMLSVAWLPLFQGKLGGHGKISTVRVKMMKTAPTPTTDKDKKKPDQKESPVAVREWQGILQKSFPIEITRFEIEDATIEFEDRSSSPVAKVTVDQFHLVASDLSNRPKGNAELPAHVEVTARIAGSGNLRVDVRADPSNPQPRFATTMELKGLSLPALHDLLAAYALVDVTSGRFDLYSEINAAGGHYDGYLKPFLENPQFKAVRDPNKNIVERAASKAAAAVTELLKNDQQQVATKAPFHGDFAANDVDVWTTVENLLRNAFIQSLRQGFEGWSPGK